MVEAYMGPIIRNTPFPVCPGYSCLVKVSTDPVLVSHLLFMSKKISSGSRCISKLPVLYRNALIAIQSDLYQAWIRTEADQDTRLAIELMVAQCYT